MLRCKYDQKLTIKERSLKKSQSNLNTTQNKMKFTALLIATVDAIKVMESAFDMVEHVDQEVHIGGIHDLATNSTMPHDEWLKIDMIVHDASHLDVE